MPKKLGGLGMVNINNFWKALRLSWFRQLIESKATWEKIHRAETAPYTFCPISSNYESLMKARLLCKNGFWKEMYASLITCRLNEIIKDPAKFVTILSMGNPQLPKIKQRLCRIGLEMR